MTAEHDNLNFLEHVDQLFRVDQYTYATYA